MNKKKTFITICLSFTLLSVIILLLVIAKYFTDTLNIFSSILRTNMELGMSPEFQLIFIFGLLYLVSTFLSIIVNTIFKITEKLKDET